MWFGGRLRLFTEAAILADGAARRKQRTRLAVAYILSSLIAVLVCLPAVLLLLSKTNSWSILGLIGLIVALPLAIIPLLLTVGYNAVWLILRRKLEARLLSARKT